MCGSNVDVLKLFLVLHSIHNLILLWNHQNTRGPIFVDCLYFTVSWGHNSMHSAKGNLIFNPNLLTRGGC